jgi:hypothetical protein
MPRIPPARPSTPVSDLAMSSSVESISYSVDSEDSFEAAAPVHIARSETHHRLDALDRNAIVQVDSAGRRTPIVSTMLLKEVKEAIKGRLTAQYFVLVVDESVEKYEVHCYEDRQSWLQDFKTHNAQQLVSALACIPEVTKEAQEKCVDDVLSGRIGGCSPLMEALF